MLNVGYGQDLSIRDLCTLLQEVMNTDCKLEFDRSKPDGTPRKLVDSSRLTELGWKAPTTLKEGDCENLCLVQITGTLARGAGMGIVSFNMTGSQHERMWRFCPAVMRADIPGRHRDNLAQTRDKNS